MKERTKPDKQLTPHFRLSEFRCPCCGDVIESAAKQLAERLEVARNYYGAPMRIVSGYRCSKHNAKVKGATFSQHLVGLAADLECDSDANRFVLLCALTDAGFRRIGLAANYIHADIGQVTGPVCWTYYPR